MECKIRHDNANYKMPIEYEKDPGLFSLKIYHAGKFKYVDDKRKYVNGLVAYVDWCDIDKFSVHEIHGVMEKLGYFRTDVILVGENQNGIWEYVVDVTSANVNKLVVGLLPWDNSVAFVNGIEVLSVPDKLFSVKVTPIPLGDGFELPGRVGFETVYRVDMGGSGLLPKDDPFWRKWDSDEEFLVNPAAARNVSVDPGLIRYHDGVASDVAPNLVYAIAEEMADAKVNNQRFNISWWFEVEQGFGYFIRLHFCDIVGSKLHDLVFNVYINNQSAIDSLDISHMVKGLSTAYFVDFFTNVSMGSDNILVQVGPNHLKGYIPTVLLNGLEIMKMSNLNDSLDGKLAVNLDSSNTKKNKKMRGMIVLFSCLAGGLVIVLLLLLSFVLFLCCRHKKKPEKDVSVARSPIPTYVDLTLCMNKRDENEQKRCRGTDRKWGRWEVGDF
ncbi:receptor-like protein kinase THESEUS 1 [Tanacetum coccineum]